MRRNITIAVILAVIAIIVCTIIFISNDNKTKQITANITDPDEVAKTNSIQNEPTYGNLTEKQIIDYTFELLNIFYRLYYVTQDDSDEAGTDSEFVMSMLTENMNDKNKLEDLSLRSQALAETNDKVVSLTGMSLFLGVTALSESHQSFVDYLRSVNTDDVDLAEFRYQMALFQSKNKDAFNTIIEGTAMYPYVFIKFSENEDEGGTIALSEEGQQKVLTEIDRLFGDIFVEDEQWHTETGNRNAVVIIVQNYRNFLTSEE